MQIRGGLAILFGLAVLVSPDLSLGGLVTLFAAYAVVDGIVAAVWGVLASREQREGWPVVLEGVFSIAIGAAAFVVPWEAGRFVRVIAAWGLVTGVVELLAAVRAPRGVPQHWSLVAAGAWSLFLSLMVVSLPHALTEALVVLLGVYAVGFGVLVSVAALKIRSAGTPAARRPASETWTTR